MVTLVDALESFSAEFQDLTAAAKRVAASAAAATNALSKQRVVLVMPAPPPEFLRVQREVDDRRALGRNVFDRTTSTDLAIREAAERIVTLASRLRTGV